MFTGKKQSIESYNQENKQEIPARKDYEFWGLADQVMLEYLLTQYTQDAISRKIRRIMSYHHPLQTPNKKRNEKLKITTLKLKEI